MNLSNWIVVAALTVCFSPLGAHSQPRATLRACMERASIDSAMYPQRVDKGTTITGVSCRESAGRVIYVYDNKLDALKSELAPDAIQQQATTIRTMLCTNSQLTILLKLLDMEYVYYDVANVHVGTITNRIEDCHKLPSGNETYSLPSRSNTKNWVIVSERSDGGAILEVDRASLVRKGSTVRVWTRAAYRKAFSIEGSSDLRSRLVLALNEIDCVERTETVRRIVFLSEDEQPIPLTDKGPYAAADIVPGTPKEKVFFSVCSHSTTK